MTDAEETQTTPETRERAQKFLTRLETLTGVIVGAFIGTLVVVGLGYLGNQHNVDAIHANTVVTKDSSDLLRCVVRFSLEDQGKPVKLHDDLVLVCGIRPRTAP